MEKRHKHHIIPRHLGGGDEVENIELLDPVAHAELHALRFIEGQDRWFDCRHEGWTLLDPRLQLEVKQKMGEINSQNSGENHGSYGKNIHSEEFKQRRSKEMTGPGNPMFGVERPDSRERCLKDPPSRRPGAREKLRAAALGRTVSEETKQKISDSTKGKPKSKEMREKLSASLKGKKKKPWTDEQKARHTEAMKRAWETRRLKK